MSGFSWFDTEEELNEFIEHNKVFDIKVIDAIEITGARNLFED